jgi:hypothetical protein
MIQQFLRSLGTAVAKNLQTHFSFREVSAAQLAATGR